MQNALVVGPIAVFLADAGPAPVSQTGQDFSDSFAEDLAVPVDCCPDPDETEATSVGSISWEGSLFATSALGVRTALDNHAPVTDGADEAGELPASQGGLWHLLLPTADDAGSPGQDAGSTDPETGPEIRIEAGADRLGDAIPPSPSDAKGRRDPPSALGEGRNVMPLPTGPWPAAASRPMQGAEPDTGAPAQALQPFAAPEVLDPAPDPAMGAGTAANALPVAEDGQGVTQAPATGRAEPRLAQPVPGNHADNFTGNAPETGHEPRPDTAQVTETGAHQARTQPAALGTPGKPQEVANGQTANAALASGSGQTRADQPSQPLRSAPGPVLPVSQVFRSDQPAAAGNQISASIWERVILDATPNHVRAPSRSVLDGPAFPAIAKSVANPIAGVLVEPWLDALSDHGKGAENPLASGILGPSFGPAGQHGSATASAPIPIPQVPIPQVAVQLASVLRHGSGGVTELALAPAELGRVRLRMESDAKDPDRLVVVITVERPETLDLFRRHAGELAEAIRDAGFSGSSIDFGQDQDGEKRLTNGGQEDRGNHASPVSEDEPATHTPMRHVIGETLDLRL